MVSQSNTLRLKSLRVVGIQIRNYKRLVALDLAWSDKDGIIVVAGENSQGKTSAAEAVAIGLGLKAKTGLKQPVNKNAPEGKGYGVVVQLGNPDLAYTIKHWSDPEGKSEGFEVISEDTGRAITNPKSWMKDVLDGLKNPVDILTMEPIELRKQLIAIGGVDVDALDAAINQAKTIEKDAERAQSTALARVENLPWHDDAPEKELSAGDLSAKIQQATDHNSHQDWAIRQLDSAAAQIRQALSSFGDDFKILDLGDTLLEHMGNRSIELARNKTDLEPLQAQMAGLDGQNRKFRENQALLEAKRIYEEAEAATKSAIESRKAAEVAKRKAISEAKFPVEGLGFDEKEVTYNDIPFSNAGNAERIRVAVAICLAGRGALPFLLIDNAEALDNKSLRLLIEEVDRQGAQCLAFAVANQDDEGFHDRECSFAIVNGNLVKPKVKPTDGKGGDREPSQSNAKPERNAEPSACPTCGGYACGPFCMNGDEA